MSKKTIYILISSAIVIVIALIVLSKKGIIGNKDKAIDVEVAKANEIIIVERYQPQVKSNQRLRLKFHRRFRAK